jgi:sugar lactone lactonase YvrE
MRNKILFIAFIISAFNLSAQPNLVKLWETTATLKVPESVLYAARHRTLFVSNVEGDKPWDKDGKGSIAKVSLDGKTIVNDWVTGLNAPKGMGIRKGRLYVADLTEVVVIDIATAAIVRRIPIAGAVGLNDVAIDRKGNLYVSDSHGGKVYCVRSQGTEVVLDSLKTPNGVHLHNNTLYVLANGGMHRMNADKSLTKIADGMEGGVDGIEHIKGNGFIVSCWQGVIWHVATTGVKHQLLDTRAQSYNTADIGMDKKAMIIYVPTFWKNSVVAYRVEL